MSSPLQEIGLEHDLYIRVVRGNPGASLECLGQQVFRFHPGAALHLYLCERGDTTRVATSQIGRAQHIPVTFLAKIVAQLSAAG